MGTKGYHTVASRPLSFLQTLLNHQYDSMMVDGYRVGTRSTRYKVFNRSPSCVVCGIVGSLLLIQTQYVRRKRQRIPNPQGYHVNLWAIGLGGSLILMTKDHIIPKSYDGPNNLENLQTMCEKCNERKGNLLCPCLTIVTLNL